MKRKRIVALLSTCAAICAVPLAPVRAGNFSVQGGLAATACLPGLTRTADAGDGMLVLGRLALHALPVIGSTADAGRFSIFLDACRFSADNVISAWFYSSAAGAVSHGRLNPLPGNHAGWQYQFLLAGAGNAQLDVGTSPTMAVSPIHLGTPQAADTASLDYRVRYYRSGVTLIAGSGIGQVTYVLYHH